MTQHRGRLGNLIIVTLLITLLQIPSFAVASEKGAKGDANCDVQKGACVQNLGGGIVTLDILPRPVTAMTDLTFNIVLENLDPDGVPIIDLGMPGMEMGPNQVVTEKVSGDKYTGTGVIVRCPSGRTLWQATVTVPGIGNASFTFHVAY